MALNPNVDSRFRFTEPIRTSDGKDTFGIQRKQTFLIRSNLEDRDIRQITITSDLAGRPDKIAEKVYQGRSDLDWVIIIFNRVQNPFEYPAQWPRINQTIEYPAPRLVFAET